MASLPRRALLCAALSGVLLLAGCVAGPAPSDHFYRLHVGGAAPVPSPLIAGTLEVDRLRSDAVTSDRYILYRQGASDTEVQRHTYHKWTDSPTILVQLAMVKYLRAAGVAERVTSPEMRLTPDYRVTGRLVRLERLLDDSRVVLEIEISVTDAAGRESLLIGSYREERAASGNEVAAAVAAFDDALTAALQRFVADLAGS